MRTPFVLLAMLGMGGTDRTSSPVAEEHQQNEVAVGQKWSDAERIARDPGDQLGNAADLAMESNDGSPIEGFVIDLPGGDGLIAFRDPATDSVKSLEYVENLSGPKIDRNYHVVLKFEVPAPGP